LKLPVFVSYGSTEMASQITTTGEKDRLKKWKTAGKVLSHRNVKISQQGEILVKGKTLYKGYIQSGKLKKVTDKTGWFHSGDLGQLDKDGYLTVFGRKDNMFISGGENIQPEEIEQCIRNIAGVEEVVVVPVEDREFGMRPVAIIKMQGDNKYQTKHKSLPGRRTGQKIKYKIQNTKYRLQEMKVYLKRVLPGFKVPDYFLPWPEKAGKGLKISRAEFRLWAAGELRKKENDKRQKGN
jgi:O-succinylbenzoic acid--CoA ligase